jgi:hypothetical protein
MKGKLVRSRAQWVDEGEKPTKYFCGLESKNYTSKIIPKELNVNSKLQFIIINFLNFIPIID